MLERVGRVLRAGLRRTMAAIGDPPSMDGLDQAYIQTERDELTAAILPVIERAVMGATEVQTGEAKADPMVVPITWDQAVIAGEAARWAVTHAGALIGDIVDHTFSLVREGVARFMRTPGMTIGDLRRTLEPAFGETRAQRIAVTETTRAFAAGQKLVQDELRRGGLGLERIWRTSNDERVCPICGPLEDRRESEGWDGMDGPPAHVNCRCWTVLSL